MYITIPYYYCNNIVQYKYGKGDDNMDVYECKICGKLFSGRKRKYCSQACSDEARRIRNRNRWRKDNPNWNEQITSTCKYCGKEFIHSKRVPNAKYCSDKCRYTAISRAKGIRPMDVVIKERKEQARINYEANKKQRLIKNIKKLIENTIKELEREEEIKELTRPCLECGDMFYNPSHTVLVCSSECSRKRNRRLSRMAYKRRINEHNLVDKDISLVRLYKRDGGVCYICGEHCNWSDKEVTEEGYTIVGDKYPTIEHVIPLSKGGKHSWDNVKLSCMRCNVLKRDKLLIKK